VIQADMKAFATGSVVRNAVNPLSTDVHNFATMPTGLEDPVNSTVKGSATGVGDLLLRGKYYFLETENWIPNMAAVGQVTFPTGDEDNLLGTGDWRGMMMLVADKQFGRITPHVNLGYEIVGGNSELNTLRYIFGADARLHERVTGVVDLIGRWEPSGDGRGDHLVDSAFGTKLAIWDSLVLVTNFIVPLNRNHGLRPDFVFAFGLEYTFGVFE
jgi:hypothetical protein